MRLKTYSVLAALLFASNTTASGIRTTTASTVGRLDDLIPSFTPFPGRPNLEIRQNLDQQLIPSAKPAAAGDQVPPVTIYSIVSQLGPTGKTQVLTYTQTFAKVLDQFPAPRQGQIGLGNLKGKREVEAVPEATPIVNTGYVAQPLVLQMETVMVTQPLRRVTEILVVETWTVNVRNATAATATATEKAITTTHVANSMLPPASFGTAANRPLASAPN